MATTLSTPAPSELAPAAGEPPAPAFAPLMQTLAWALVPTLLLDRCAQSVGDSFTLTLAPSGRRFVVVSDPQAVKELMTAPAEVAPSATNESPIAGVLGPSSVITLTGAEHMRQRKLLLPPFHGERMRAYEETIVAATERDMRGWQLGRPLRMAAHTRAITLEVILRAVFGARGEQVGELGQAIRALAEPARTLTLLRFALTPGARRPDGATGRALAHLDERINAVIARRREQPDLAEREDILSLLLQARHEQGEAMTDGELRDELVSLLLAGHETTATATAWALERLARHREVLARLLAEVDADEGDEYMQAVIHETLRVRPVVPAVVRVLQAPLTLAGRELPAGTRVMASIYLTNRSPAAYSDPRVFRPERFLGRGPDTFAWIPFGGGIRRCIGASFAMLEMKLMLRTMLRELRPEVPRGSLARRGEWTRRRAITLVPAGGARVTWERR